MGDKRNVFHVLCVLHIVCATARWMTYQYYLLNNNTEENTKYENIPERWYLVAEFAGESHISIWCCCSHVPFSTACFVWLPAHLTCAYRFDQSIPSHTTSRPPSIGAVWKGCNLFGLDTSVWKAPIILAQGIILQFVITGFLYQILAISEKEGAYNL